MDFYEQRAPPPPPPPPHRPFGHHVEIMVLPLIIKCKGSPPNGLVHVQCLYLELILKA